MKNLTIILACLLLMACDKKSDSAAPVATTTLSCENLEYVGSWDNQDVEDTLTVNSDCTAQSSYCEHDYTFTIPNTEGFSFLTVNNVNSNEGCMSFGTYVCNIDISKDDLHLDCGVTNQFYFTRNVL